MANGQTDEKHEQNTFRWVALLLCVQEVPGLYLKLRFFVIFLHPLGISQDSTSDFSLLHGICS